MCDFDSYYDEQDDDIYGGQFHDEEEDDYIDDPFSGEPEKEQETAVKQEWIELECDPFSDGENPQGNQSVLMWYKPSGVVYLNKFNVTYDYIGRGYTHWMPAPEGPVKLLEFSEVVVGIKFGKKYKRQYGTQILCNLDSQVSIRDTQQSDWVEV